MRSVLLLLALLALSNLLHAQEQESKAVQRIMDPDRTLASPLQNQAYNDGKSFGAVSPASVNSFHIARTFTAKSFSSKAYAGAGNFWAGDFKYSTTAARTSGFLTKAFGVRRMDVKDARESGKTSVSAGRSYNRAGPFKGHGTRQGLLDEQNSPKAAMTIDQVRDLLNKNQ